LLIWSTALKHYTSKLRTYADLESVTTFGFRGEALSSLCALSDFHIITATAAEAPKGNKLEFENSGKLKSKSTVPSMKGTTVCVANLFKSLPVRRRELERNIRRDYAKVLNLLQAYAGICVGVKFSVFNQPSKGCAVLVCHCVCSANGRHLR
jgi:DNA mismatch repair protein PMS2